MRLVVNELGLWQTVLPAYPYLTTLFGRATHFGLSSCLLPVPHAMVPLAFCSVLFSTPNSGDPSGNQRGFLPRDLRVCSVSSNQIANFGRNCSLSTASPTNSSMTAILRESAEASPRFAYAIILTRGT